MIYHRLPVELWPIVGEFIRCTVEIHEDSIKLTHLISNVIDKETQEKIDIVKTRLIKNYGYNEESATDVLNFVASIFARGDVKD